MRYHGPFCPRAQSAVLWHTTLVSWNKILGAATVAVATGLLGIVAFDVPYVKAVYRPRTAEACSAPPLKSGTPSLAGGFINGTLPPALSASVNTVGSALTKVLVLHIVAFGISLISFAFALLAFLGAPIADCCSSCFCGFAGSAAFAVFIFDIAFFELIKKRVQDVGNSGAAVMGNALYLTLFAWLLLFITPVMFLIGRCSPTTRTKSGTEHWRAHMIHDSAIDESGSTLVADSVLEFYSRATVLLLDDLLDDLLSTHITHHLSAEAPSSSFWLCVPDAAYIVPLGLALPVIRRGVLCPLSTRHLRLDHIVVPATVVIFPVIAIRTYILHDQLSLALLDSRMNAAFESCFGWQLLAVAGVVVVVGQKSVVEERCPLATLMYHT
ncbi:hypothetical protein C8F01DRAFT_1084038 [Mycena amicta]|nr:hypothetical protein C8F01DRAFT_1084038 [Mycena amicta]